MQNKITAKYEKHNSVVSHRQNKILQKSPTPVRTESTITINGTLYTSMKNESTILTDFAV